MREMKDSGVEWIGNIPNTWDIVPFYSFLDDLPNSIVDGPFGSDLKNEDFVENGIPVIQIGSIRDNGMEFSRMHYITTEKADTLKRHNAFPNDIAIAKMMPAAKACEIPDNYERYVVSADVIKASISNKVVRKYLIYALNNCATMQALIEAQGSTRSRVNINKVKHFKIPRPCNDQYIRIVIYLDSKCSKIDNIIAKQQSIIEKLKEYKLSIITEAVTKGLNPNAEMKDSGVEWIGEIPSHWSLTKIKRVADFHNGDRSSRYPSGDDIVEKGILFVTSNNLGPLFLDTNIESNKYITEKKYSELGGAKLKRDDIIFCLRGSVGKCGINKYLDDGTIASSLVNIRPTKINPDYLNLIMHNPGVTSVACNNAIGIGSLNLSAKDISEVVIPIPPPHEATEIVEKVMSKIIKIENCETIAMQMIEFLNEYKKSLIYEVVTGKKEVEA